MQFIDEFPYCGITLFDKSFHLEIIEVLMNGATMSEMVDKSLKQNILLGTAFSVSKVLPLLIILHILLWQIVRKMVLSMHATLTAP